MTEVQKIKKAMRKVEKRYLTAGPVERQRLMRQGGKLVARLEQLKGRG